MLLSAVPMSSHLNYCTHRRHLAPDAAATPALEHRIETVTQRGLPS
jgi:hypothetical protein